MSVPRQPRRDVKHAATGSPDDRLARYSVYMRGATSARMGWFGMDCWKHNVDVLNYHVPGKVRIRPFPVGGEIRLLMLLSTAPFQTAFLMQTSIHPVDFYWLVVFVARIQCRFRRHRRQRQLVHHFPRVLARLIVDYAV